MTFDEAHCGILSVFHKLYVEVINNLSTDMLKTCLLSDVVSNRRLLSSSRCGCHGLHVSKEIGSDPQEYGLHVKVCMLTQGDGRIQKKGGQAVSGLPLI